MELIGIYRSKVKVSVYEDHPSGRLTEQEYDFYLFDGIGRVNSYVGSDLIPKDQEHHFWKSYSGTYQQSESGFDMELFNSDSNPVASYRLKIIDTNNIEIINIKNGRSVEYEKVSDL